MDTFIGERIAVNHQANKKIDTMESKIDIVESSLDKRIDGFQREIDQQFDNLHKSISRITNQHDHQEEENPEEEFLINTILGEQVQLQLQEELKEEPTEALEELQDAPQLCVVLGPWRRKEEILPLISEEGSGKGAGEEPQKPIAQATNSPLPCADPMHILPSPAAHSTLETPTSKAILSPLPALQNLKKLVAYVQTCATTSKTLVAAHTAWHNGWFGCWFRCGASGPQHFYKLHQFQQPLMA